MRTKSVQHRKRLLLDLQKNSDMNRDDGEEPKAQTSDHAAGVEKGRQPVKHKRCSSFSYFKGEEPYWKIKKG